MLRRFDPHGNPTSSYLMEKGHPGPLRSRDCIAPDLIGMGDSAKVFRGPHTYTFLDYQDLEAFLDGTGIEENVTLVGHDWGGPLLFDWGRRHPESVRAVAQMETIVTSPSWSGWPEAARRMFERLRSEAGEEMVLEKSLFVERLLPASVLEPMSEAVLEV